MAGDVSQKTCKKKISAVARHGRKTRSKEQFIQSYVYLKKRLGRRPLFREYIRKVGGTLLQINRVFGKPGWRNMLRVVGDRPGWRPCKTLSKEHFINDYVELKKKLGRLPTYREFYRATKHSDGRLNRYFGKPGWRTLQQTLGDKPHRSYQLDIQGEQAYIAEYVRLKQKLGRQPTLKEFSAHTGNNINVLDYVFGKPGWRNLVESAGDQFVKCGRKGLDGQHLVDHYSELKRILGRKPTYREYEAHAKHYIGTIVKCFGKPGWSNLARVGRKNSL